MLFENVSCLILEVTNSGPKLPSSPLAPALRQGALPIFLMIYAALAYKELKKIFYARAETFTTYWEVER